MQDVKEYLDRNSDYYLAWLNTQYKSAELTSVFPIFDPVRRLSWTKWSTRACFSAPLEFYIIKATYFNHSIVVLVPLAYEWVM